MESFFLNLYQLNPQLFGLCLFIGPFVIFVVIGVVVSVIQMDIQSRTMEQRMKTMTPEELKQLQEETQAQTFNEAYGQLYNQIICPHCGLKGVVRTKQITKKHGISGAKATGAILTGGFSLLATGLSKKENITEAHCTNCNQTWHY